MLTDFWPLIIVLALCWIAWASFERRYHYPASDPVTVSATVHRLLKPRTPVDCPACRRH